MKTLILPLAIALIVITSCNPTDYEVKREITINAPSDIVFSLVNNHKERDAWSPWEAKDGGMTKTYEGPESGVGAIYKWTGDDSVGTGWMEILESEPNKKIKSKLVFTEPFQSESILNWNFSETDGKTKAIWTVNGELPGYLFWMGQDDMEEQLGPDFETGLANLKRVAEEKGETVKSAANLTVELVLVESMPYYYIEGQTPISSLGQDFFSERYSKLMAYIGEEGQNNMLGAPFAIFSDWDEENDMATIEVAIASRIDKPGNNEIKKGETYSGDALKCVFKGSYDSTGKAHELILTYANNNNLEIAGSPWEVFVKGPGTESDEENYLTEVFYPIKKG